MTEAPPPKDRKSGKSPIPGERPSGRVRLPERESGKLPIDLSKSYREILDLGTLDEASKVRQRLEIKIEALKSQGVDPRKIADIINREVAQRAFESTNHNEKLKMYLTALYQISLLNKDDFDRHINGLVHRLGGRYLRPYGLEDRNEVIEALIRSDILRESLKANDMMGVNLIVRSIFPEVMENTERAITAGSNPSNIDFGELRILRKIIVEFGIPPELEHTINGRLQSIELNIERTRLDLLRAQKIGNAEEIRVKHEAFKSHLLEKDALVLIAKVVTDIYKANKK